jgi:hypothetical protein
VKNTIEYPSSDLHCSPCEFGSLEVVPANLKQVSREQVIDYEEGIVETGLNKPTFVQQEVEAMEEKYGSEHPMVKRAKASMGCYQLMDAGGYLFFEVADVTGTGRVPRRRQFRALD